MKSLLIVVFAAALSRQSPVNIWDIFAGVTFNPLLIKELNEYYLVPSFDSRIRSYEGKEVTLKGYYIPTELQDKHTIILSRKPLAECFFCGGAGPESVAEIVFSSPAPSLEVDQIITVTGILKLNEKNVNHMNFILTKSKVIAKE